METINFDLLKAQESEIDTIYTALKVVKDTFDKNDVNTDTILGILSDKAETILKESLERYLEQNLGSFTFQQFPYQLLMGVFNPENPTADDLKQIVRLKNNAHEMLHRIAKYSQNETCKSRARFYLTCADLRRLRGMIRTEGGFMSAVLRGDFILAQMRADGSNEAALLTSSPYYC